MHGIKHKVFVQNRHVSTVDMPEEKEAIPTYTIEQFEYVNEVTMLWQLANELYTWLMDKESVAEKVNLVIYIRCYFLRHLLAPFSCQTI